MPDNKIEEGEVFERVQRITQSYTDLRTKVENSEPVKGLEGQVEYVTLSEFTMEMYSEIFKSYTLRLIDKFLAFLKDHGTEIPLDKLQHIEENILNSASILLTDEEGDSADTLKPINKSRGLQQFIVTALTPLRDTNKLNGSVAIELGEEDWDAIIAMSKKDIGEVNKGLFQDAKQQFLEIMQRKGISNSEDQMRYLEVSIEFFGDLRQIVGEIIVKYADDAFNNITADCSIVFQRIMMDMMFGD